MNKTPRTRSSAAKQSRPTKSPTRRRRVKRKTREQRAIELHGRGVAAGRRGDYPTAMRLLMKASALRPDDATIWTNLGLALLRAGREADSVVPFTMAANIISDTPPGELEAEDGRMLWVVGEQLSEREPERALVLQRQAVELLPEDPRVCGALAEQLLAMSMCEEALPHARKAVALDPDDDEAVGVLLAVYIGTGMFWEAQDLGEKALGQWPANPCIRFNLGIAYLDHGQVERAAEVFAGQLEFDPHDPEAHAYAGVAYAALGWDENARQAQAEARKYGAGQPLVDQLTAEIDDFLDSDPDGEGAPPNSEADLAKWIVAAALARNALKRRPRP